ncbi:MAG: DEAD/DEAH box helicase [Polyangiales bacterium]
MTAPLAPTDRAASTDEVLDRFLAYVDGLGLSLYPAQEEAVLELFAGKNVILNTPTGSGKSLVATALHFKALTEGGRSYYTSPIKALVNEKFLALCKDFGPENVGMVTGDARVNGDAPIICCTAEILANRALREGKDLDVDAVILDEFHYYGDRDRGWAWQVPLLSLPQARFLLMSATLGPMDRFVEELEKRTGVETKIVRGMDRPVPLDFAYLETPLHESVASIVSGGRAPLYLVNFTQRACAEVAQDLMSQDFASKDEKRAIAEALKEFRFDSPYGKEIQRFLRHGIAVHHAGLLPKYRLLVEKLAQRGLLKVISGTDTLGVGVNVPIRSVLFTRLCKYDGEKTVILPVRDFQQISGRAGRKGFDTQGYVYAQAPEHVIENLKLEEKAAKDPSKKKKIVRKKPPEFGYLHWDKGTFERLMSSQPEPLVSRFQITHGMILNVLQRPRGGGCKAIIRLVRDSHETPKDKQRLRTHGLALWKSLVDAGIVDEHRQLHIDLQDEFSLNQSLALWLVDTIGMFSPESDTYAHDVLTLAESIVENPDVVLRAQLDKLKGDLVAKLKAEGVEYDDRMKQLEELEYPKPNRELVYDTFNAFAKKHPWVSENIRPKSIAREMSETMQTFSGYVKTYGLQRAEGVLLRYLSEVYKVMVQTVPAPMKTEAVEDLTAFLGAIVRGTDASLLEEWERLRDPTRAPAAAAPTETVDTSDVTRDVRGFTVLVRNAMFKLVSAFARRDARSALELVAQDDWTEDRLREMLAAYFADHAEIKTDASARAPSHLKITSHEGRWELQQTLLDEDGDNDWIVEADVDLALSREQGEPVLRLRRLFR